MKLILLTFVEYTAPKFTHLALSHPVFQAFTGYQYAHNALQYKLICAFLPALLAILAI
jgi:hypothetical protein